MATDKKVLFILCSGMGSITSRIRGLIYDGPLRAQGWQVGYVEYAPAAEASLVAHCAQYDLVYLLKVPSIALIRALRQRTRAKLVFDLTDALWMPHHRWNQWQDLEPILSEVDAVFSDNEFVADYGRKYNRQVHVIAACTQVEAFDAVRAQQPARSAQALTLGWVGTASTLSALTEVTAPLNRLFARYPNLHLRILALNYNDPAALPPFTFANFSVVPQYDEPQMIREVLNLDIGLFPPPCGLEDYAIRGPLKGLIYMTGGIACVCQRGGSLDRIIIDGENGMLADEPDEWEAKIATLIESTELRQRMGARALETVRRANSLEVITDKLAQAFTAVLADGAEAPASAPKKVLIVCSHYWPSSGGLESRMGQFSAELVKAGYATDILTQALPNRTADTLNGVRILSIAGPEFTGAIRAAVASGTYDACILIQDPLGSIIWSLEGLTPPARTRVLIQPIINEDGYSRWKDHPTFRPGLTRILQAASVPLVMTRSGPDTRYMREEQLPAVYLPNATTPNPPAGDFRAQYGIPPDRFLVLHVANLYWVKNHVALIDTLHDMPAHWQLVMVGNESGEPDCVQAVRARLAERPDILFIPGLSKEWVAAAMQAADVVVLASLGEGSPITILEAMSHGLPWLATPQCGAANDHLGGFIVDLPAFPAHLAALERQPALRAELGRISQAHWEQCYSWPVAMQGWFELIEDGRLQRSFGPGPALQVRMDQARRSLYADPALLPALDAPGSRWPLVSVVIPTYNRPDMLARAVASVLRQDYPRLEVLVVNDAGSPVDAALAALPGEGRVQVINLPENGGAARARNAGLRAARGHYIAFLDDDDEYRPEHIGQLVAALHGRPERFAYARAEYLIEHPGTNGVEVTRQQPFATVQYARSLLEVGNFIPTPTWFFARSLLEEVGYFDESFKAWEDWEWLVRVSAATGFLALNRISVDVHQRAGDASHLGVQHRPQMRQWFERVYAMHPASSPEVAQSRQAYLASLFPADGTTGARESPLEALALCQLDIVEIINRAEALTQAGHWQQAAQLYTDWLTLSESPLRYAGAYNLGCLFSSRGNGLQAAQAFGQAVQFKPDFASGHFALAMQLEALGDLAQAQAHYRWIVEPAHGVAQSQPDQFQHAQARLASA